VSAAIYQIPRNSLAWMLAAQAAVIAPHVLRLPFWVVSVCLACMVWRVMVFQGRWSFPGRWTKILLVLSGFAAVPLAYDKIYGVEPAVSLLMVAFALKLIEMHQKRDAYMLILLAYFVCTTEFLFEQSIPYAIYMFGCVTMVTTALIGLHQTQSHLKPFKTLKSASLLLLQAVPLMFILFVLFPRISPLWTVPLTDDRGITGVTDRMTPGSVASLTASDELVFKATFEGAPPKFRDLYWRGLVLTEFDGTTWTQNEEFLRRSVYRYRQVEPGWVEGIKYQGNAYQYDVIMEPSYQNWMFSLMMPEVPEDRDYVILHDFRVASSRKIRQKIRYQLTSHLDYSVQEELSDFWRYRYTRLPKDSNPRAVALAKQMYSTVDSAEEMSGRIQIMFYEQEFVYTLQPGATVAEHSIDAFLFDSKRGFCERYASAYVFMMRAAGIPARIVVGYQGGEYNPNGNYVAVRQFDAHAWAEIWFAGKGWVRVDPTSAVAPERIERGLEAAVEDENTFLANSPLSIFRYKQLLWLTELRLQIDAIGHYWDTWVVGYTPEMQTSLLSRFFDDISPKRLGTLMLASFFSVLFVIALFLLAKRSRTPLSTTDTNYLRFCRTMEKRGVPRRNGEGPLDYQLRLIEEFPALEIEVRAVTEAYVTANYMGDPAKSGSKSSDLKKAVRALWLRTLTT
jgi:transglutaminase-like putative cysteine protease